MRSTRAIRVVLGLLVLCGATAALATLARAGDPAPGAPPPPRKIANAFLRSLVGDWDVITSGPMGGQTARSTWRLSTGETALVEEYTGRLTMEKGETIPWHVTVLVREGPEGKTAEGWLFDSWKTAPDHYTGSLSADGFDVSAKTPEGTVRVVAAKKDFGVEFRMSRDGKEILVEQYRPSGG
jgi:hypothetical protein